MKPMFTVLMLEMMLACLAFTGFTPPAFSIQYLFFLLSMLGVEPGNETIHTPLNGRASQYRYDGDMRYIYTCM